MAKYTAVIIGRDFIKEEEIDGSIDCTEIMERMERKYPGCVVQYYKKDGRAIELDFGKTGLWGMDELGVPNERS
jgi:hypothetical protein